MPRPKKKCDFPSSSSWIHRTLLTIHSFCRWIPIGCQVQVLDRSRYARRVIRWRVTHSTFIYNTHLTLLPCLTQLETSSRIETLSSSWYFGIHDLQSVVKCSLNQQRKLIYFRVICAHVIGWFFSNLTWFNKHPKGQSPKDGRLLSISYSLFYFSFYTSI